MPDKHPDCDTEHTPTDGNDKVMMTFWVSPQKRDEIRAYAKAHEMTMSRLIVEGVNWRLRQE